MADKRILSVGNCAADHGSLAQTLELHFPVEVVSAATSREAVEKLSGEPFALVLVNRVFDADGASGLDFIRRLKADEHFRPVPVMLLSNREDAQRQAEQSGALPGFGKSDLGEPHMLDRLKGIL
jgi:CheY-like chemotaxis protein